MSPLSRMLWRDFWHMRGQVIATAVVIACGIATLLAMRSTYHSLLEAQQSYYRDYRFADVFAQLGRAPEAVASAARDLPGVAVVNTRVVHSVTVDVPGLAEPATVKLVSIPARPAAVLNDLHLVRGRYIGADAADEVIASAVFAAANGLQPGDRIGAILNGRWRLLSIVGTALSPEYVYEVAPGALMPDNRRFGVLWMSRDALDSAFDMRGAFNDISLQLVPGASRPPLLHRLDQLLDGHGGLGSYDRDQQLSNRFVSDELAELQVSTGVIPVLFLVIAAFLLYVTLARVMELQRQDVGLLKAFGYSDSAVSLHYLQFALLVAGLGVLIGVPSGLLLAHFFVDIYRDYFHFPQLDVVLRPSLVLGAAAAAAAAASLGASASIRTSLRLAPAEAMRPPAPPHYRPGWTERMGALRAMSPAARMIVRNLTRRPGRAALSILAVSAAVALMVTGRFAIDAVNRLLQIQFGSAWRSDITVTYVDTRSQAATLAAARLDGVLRAEPFRSVPVWLRHDSRERRVELQGVSPAAQLHRLVDLEGRLVTVPPDGLVLGRRLAQLLDVAPGDHVQVEMLQGERRKQGLLVASLFDDLMGLGAFMDDGALSRLLGEAGSASGAYLRIDPAREAALAAQLKRLPVAAGVSSRRAVRASIEDAMDRSFLVVSGILVSFACAIVIGIVYNTVRIALSERGRELASLRVLGFTGREVTAILLGEQALLSMVAIPCGLAAGYGLCALLVPAFDRESFRLPLVVSSRTYAIAAMVAVAASALCGLLVARRLRRLDLIAVLKTRE